MTSEHTNQTQIAADNIAVVPSGREITSNIYNIQINNNSRDLMNEDHSRGRKRDYNGELRCPREINGQPAPSDRDNPQVTRNSKKRPHEQATGFDCNNNTTPSSTGRKNNAHQGATAA
jgi:hypothetical protein